MGVDVDCCRMACLPQNDDHDLAQGLIAAAGAFMPHLRAIRSVSLRLASAHLVLDISFDAEYFLSRKVAARLAASELRVQSPYTAVSDAPALLPDVARPRHSAPAVGAVCCRAGRW